MNEEVKSNLEKLFNNNFELFKNSSIEETLDEFINDNPIVLDLNVDQKTNLFDNQKIKNLERAKKNSELISLFEIAKKMEFNDKEIISDLKTDILNSIPVLKQKIDSENNGFKNQIIFLEYDYEPYANFSGFGKGNYPILKEPEYFDFNYMEELYNGIGKVDYTKIWKDLTKLDEILEDLDIYDEVWDSTLYQGLLNSVKFKTYLFLNEAFDQIGIESFKGIEIEKPLFIYGNEHDCEAINIFVFE